MVNYIEEKEWLLTFCVFYSSTVLLLRFLSALTLVLWLTHFIHYKIHPSHRYGLFCGPSACWSYVFFPVVLFLFPPKKVLFKWLYFRIHAVLEFREYSKYIFMYTFLIHMHMYVRCVLASPPGYWILSIS